MSTTTLDAKRIAEIRELADSLKGGTPGMTIIHLTPEDALALCDLAERGLAMDRAIGNVRAIDEDCEIITNMVLRHTAEILASSTNERKG